MSLRIINKRYINLFKNKTSITENDSHFSFAVAGVSLKAFPTVSEILALIITYTGLPYKT